MNFVFKVSKKWFDFPNNIQISIVKFYELWNLSLNAEKAIRIIFY